MNILALKRCVKHEIATVRATYLLVQLGKVKIEVNIIDTEKKSPVTGWKLGQVTLCDVAHIRQLI